MANDVFEAIATKELRTTKLGVNLTPVAQQTTIIDPAACAAMTATNPPAGGVGAAAGGYDTAANRDLMITSQTALVADVAALKTAVDANNAAIDTLIDRLQAFGFIS